MATFVLVHGGGGTAAGYDLVSAELIDRGHNVVAVDLPCDDSSADWADYTDAVINGIGDRTDLIVVAHSAGGFVGPLVCERVPARLLVLVAGMIPIPGETFEEWWDNTNHTQEMDPDWEDPDTFYNDVPSDLAAEDERLAEGREHFPSEPWPLESWPDVPTKYLLCRDDRVFPPEFAREVARERLGIIPDEIDSGHCVMLSRPHELASRLDAYWEERS